MTRKNRIMRKEALQNIIDQEFFDDVFSVSRKNIRKISELLMTTDKKYKMVILL